MALEQELKLTVIGRVPDFSSVQCIAGRKLVPLGLEKQLNTYFDTSDFVITRAKCALRIRALSNVSIVAFKQPGTVRNGLHSREEFESEIPAGSGLDALRDVRILSEIAHFAKLENLHPIARLETNRDRFELESIGELTLDHVRVLGYDNAIVLEFDEIELELKNTVQNDVLIEIENQIGQLVQVERSWKNKLQRALEAVLKH